MAVNGIQLAIGQRWITRGGEEVEVEGYDTTTGTPYVWDLTNGGSVTNEGSDVYEGSHSPDDLITLIQDEHGFIPWHGGECPVPDHVEIEAKLRCGDLENEVAEWFDWTVSGDQGDIIAYRVVKQKEEKPEQTKETIVETKTEDKEEPKYTVEQVFFAINEATADSVAYTNTSKVKSYLANAQDPDYKLYLELKAKFE